MILMLFGDDYDIDFSRFKYASIIPAIRRYRSFRSHAKLVITTIESARHIDEASICLLLSRP